MNIQWYPGHMTKARRMMQDNIKLVRNPDIDDLGRNKARLLLLNKADLADEAANEAWSGYFREKGFQVVKLDSRSKAGFKAVQAAIGEACREKTERDRKRGILNRPVRAMVAGIPNVGKSTFINSFAGRACAKTGNKPGVTRGAQWVRLNKQVELLDTPGILWPRFEDPAVGLKLALIGSIREEVLNTEELAMELLRFLNEHYKGLLRERYEIDEEGGAAEQLRDIAEKRGCLRKGGEADTQKAAAILLEEFRSGKLGRITLEMP